MVLGLILLVGAGVVVYNKQKKDPNSTLNRRKAKRAARKAAKRNPPVPIDNAREVEHHEVRESFDVADPALTLPPYSRGDYVLTDEKAPAYEESGTPSIPPRSPARVASDKPETGVLTATV